MAGMIPVKSTLYMNENGLRQAQNAIKKADNGRQLGKIFADLHAEHCCPARASQVEFAEAACKKDSGKESYYAQSTENRKEQLGNKMAELLPEIEGITDLNCKAMQKFDWEREARNDANNADVNGRRIYEATGRKLRELAKQGKFDGCIKLLRSIPLETRIEIMYYSLCTGNDNDSVTNKIIGALTVDEKAEYLSRVQPNAFDNTLKLIFKGHDPAGCAAIVAACKDDGIAEKIIRRVGGLRVEIFGLLPLEQQLRLVQERGGAGIKLFYYLTECARDEKHMKGLANLFEKLDNGTCRGIIKCGRSDPWEFDRFISNVGNEKIKEMVAEIASRINPRSSDSAKRDACSEAYYEIAGILDHLCSSGVGKEKTAADILLTLRFEVQIGVIQEELFMHGPADEHHSAAARIIINYPPKIAARILVAFKPFLANDVKYHLRGEENSKQLSGIFQEIGNHYDY